MRLRGRALQAGLSGGDVAELHAELVWLGHAIPDDERRGQFFGTGTARAVAEFQQANGLRPTAVVDDTTALGLTRVVGEVAARRTANLPPQPTGYPVSGPPVSAPPISAPPISAPPISAPPISAPPVSGPPVTVEPSAPPVPAERPRPGDPLDPVKDDGSGRTVAGLVADADGRPVTGLTVVLYARALRAEERIGSTTSGEDGRYLIAYQPAATNRAGRLTIRVAAVAPDGTELATTPAQYRAGDAIEVDLVVPNRAKVGAEVDRYRADLDARLDGLPLASASPEDIQFLAGDAAIPIDRVTALATAARLAAEGGDAAIPAEVWYAWQRAGLDLTPGSLWRRSPDDLVTMAVDAAGSGIVSTVPTPDGLRQLIRANQNEFRLDSPAHAGGRGSLRGLLDTAPRPISGPDRRAVARALDIDASAPPEAIAKRLQSEGLDGPTVDTVVRTLRLGRLTGDNPPLVSALQPVAGDGDSLVALAAIRPDTWIDLAHEHSDAATDAGAYARRMRVSVERAHPTATLRARLADGSVALRLPGGDQVSGFLAANPSFDIRTSPLPDAEAPVTRALRTIRRLNAITDDWSEVAALARADLTTPYDLATISAQRATQLLGHTMTQPAITSVQQKATAAHTGGLAVLPLLPKFRGPLVSSIPPPAVDGGTLGGHPTLQSLFGPLDGCACGTCRSVLGPTAYLVDLLEFLRRDATTAFTELLYRRPDLADLELSCVNAETVLPAIDLANEVLENQIALPLTVDLPPGVGGPAALSANPLPEPVMAALRRTCAEVADRLTAVKEPKPLLPLGITAWTVTDRWRRWALYHRQEGLLINVPARQVYQSVESGLNFGAAVGALNAGSVPPDVDTAIRDAFIRGGLGDLISSGTDVAGVTTRTAGQAWTVTYRTWLWVEIIGKLEAKGRLTIANDHGQPLVSNEYSGAALQATDASLLADSPGVLLDALLPAPDKFTVIDQTTTTTTARYKIAGPSIVVDLLYEAASLTVDGLTYQSVKDANLLAAPINRNPEAYRILRSAVYPWTLPYDASLAEARALLDRAGYGRGRLQALLGGDAPPDHAANLETLGLGTEEAGLITATATTDEIWKRWGLTVYGTSTTVYDAGAAEYVNGSPLSVLSRVSVLLQQSRLTLAELLDGLAASFVRGSAPTSVLTPSAECRPSRLRIETLDGGLLDRLDRFTRLRRRLGWSTAELDIALAAAGGLSDSTLDTLAHLVRLRATTGLTVAELTAWFGPLGTVDYVDHADDATVASLYRMLFAHPDHRGPADPDVALAPDRTRLAIEVAPGPAGLPVLADKATMLAAAWRVNPTELSTLIGLVGAAARLTLANLSILRRLVTLSAVIGVPAGQLSAVRNLLGLNPFQDPPSASRFVAAAQRLTGSPFTVAESAWLLRDATTPGLSIVVSPATVARTRTAIAAAVGAARTDLAARDGVGPAAARDREVEVTVAAAAAALGLDPPIVAGLLDCLTVPGGGPAVDALRDNTADAPAIILRLAKAGVLTARFGLAAAQLNWFGPAGFDGLRWDALPVGGTGAAVQWPNWRRALDLIAWRDKGKPAVVAAYLAAVTATGTAPDQRAAAGHTVLADAYNVPITTVATLAGRVIGTGSLTDPSTLAQLVDLLTATVRLGASVADLATLSGPDTDAAAARAAALLRARYTDASWLEVVQPVSDALREQRRDALLSYLVATKNLSGPDDEYERSLIDIQTSAELQTTRVLQATAAIQLFVHRCLLSLEPNVVAESISRDRWDWMKNYRVWEANRKVFLWPENWLHPELREDASTAFTALQTTLGQSDPSADTAKEVLLTYLDDLVELSQLTVLGLWETGSDLYMVGRSPNAPYRYFWRVCRNFARTGMRWLPWRQVDLDIGGTHVMPFVLGGDLHLAWPVLRKEGATPPGEWRVQLAWARLTSRGWSEKKVSVDTFPVPALPNLDEASSFAFRVDAQIARPVANSLLPVELQPTLAETEIQIGVYAAVESEPPPGPRPDTRISLDAPLPTLTFNLEVLWKDTATGLHWPCAGAFTVLFAGPPFPFILPGSTDSSGHLSATVHAFFSTEFRLVVGTHGLTETRDWLAGAAYNKNSKVWSVQVIFTAPSDVPPPAAKLLPDRKVKMVPQGMFALAGRRTAQWRASAVVDLGTVVEAQPRGMGFREDAGRSGDGLTLGAGAIQVFGASPGRFDVIPAGPKGNTAWHYKDDAASYFLRTLPGGGWIAFTDGFLLASRFRLAATTDPELLYRPDEQSVSDNGKMLTDGNRPVVAPVLTPTNDTAQGSVINQGVSFDRRSPFGPYNWELFLHVPMLVGEHLSRQGRYQDAEQWLRLVFDPVGAPAAGGSAGAERYWRFLPFRTEGRPERIEDLLNMLADPAISSPAKQDFVNEIALWRDNPFRPHEVARLRTGAYQWSVLFAYLDNLFAWGDDRFRRDTRESLVEATMLYVLAGKILGPRPRQSRSQFETPAVSYREMVGRWDEFGNTMVTLTDTALAQAMGEWSQWLADNVGAPRPATIDSYQVKATKGGLDQLASLATLGVTYFCVPGNEKLLAYWDTLEDRLFKLRHSQNIDGISQQLPLYDPPIDPDLLVRAVAAGIDLDSAVAAATAPLGPYRYAVLMQKANEFCAELKALGGAVLSANEKKDAESLARLRSNQEIAMQELIGEIRQQQLAEAAANVVALQASRDTAATKYRHYQRLLTGTMVAEPVPNNTISETPSMLQAAAAASVAGDAQGLGLVQTETDQLARMNEAQIATLVAGVSSAVATAFFIAGSYFATSFLQGLGHAANAVGSLTNAIGGWAGASGARDAVVAGHQRRRDDWVLQSNLAARELGQLDRQVLAAQIRVAIAGNELRNHRQATENSRAIDDFMRGKYSNEQLYNWMAGELGAAYFAAYQVALDSARSAEQAFRFELADAQAQFIQPTYWETQRHGLVAGEQLSRDLRRLDAAYLERNRREQELTTHVSLLRLDAMALVTLRATGACEFEVTEEVLDSSSPGQYLRRLKSVGVSIPCVVGPYTGVHARLKLIRSSVRATGGIRSGVADGYRRDDSTATDNRFVDYDGLTEVVVTSGAVEATGLWEPNLRDERRLPFEGRGAISTWRLELPTELRPFDYRTIADVVLHLRYTARDGSEQLRSGANATLRAAIADATRAPQQQLISLRQDFPTEWARLTSTTTGAASQTFTVTTDRFPYLFTGRTLTITGLDLVAASGGADAALPGLSIGATAVSWSAPTTIGQLQHATAAPTATIAATGNLPAATWTVTAPAEVARGWADLLLVVTYKVTG